MLHLATAVPERQGARRETIREPFLDRVGQETLGLIASVGDLLGFIGIFGWIGFGDRNTNILEQFYSVGIAGQGMLPGRDLDRYGIGFYYTNFSNQLPEHHPLRR